MNESHKQAKLQRAERPVKKKGTKPKAAAHSTGVSVSELAPGYYKPPSKMERLREANRHFNSQTYCFEYMFGKRTVTKRQFMDLVQK